MLRHDDGLEFEIYFCGLKECYLLPLFYCNTNVTEVYTLPTYIHTHILFFSSSYFYFISRDLLKNPRSLSLSRRLNTYI